MFILIHGAVMALYMFLPRNAAIIEVGHLDKSVVVYHITYSLDDIILPAANTTKFFLRCLGMRSFLQLAATISQLIAFASVGTV